MSHKVGCSRGGTASWCRTQAHQFPKNYEPGGLAAEWGHLGVAQCRTCQNVRPGALAKATTHPGRRLPQHHFSATAAAAYILSPVGVDTKALPAGLLRRVASVLEAVKLPQESAMAS